MNLAEGLAGVAVRVKGSLSHTSVAEDERLTDWLPETLTSIL